MKLKNGISYTSEYYDAAYKRISDIDNFVIGDASIRDAVLRYLQNAQEFGVYAPGAYDIFNSIHKNMSIKDLKYFINITNIGIKHLVDNNNSYKENVYKLMSKMEFEILALESLIEEKEIRYFNGASRVHYNNFTKEKDGAIGENNKDFFIDHKTKFSFEAKDQSSIIANLGITLPIKSKTEVPITNVSIVNEETTSGDTLTPLKESNPMNVLFKNKTFNYSVVFLEMDNKNKFNREFATLTLLLELGTVMPVNNIVISSASISSFSVESISYIDYSGKLVSVTQEEIENNFTSNYIFKAVNTDKLIIKFIQKTPIGTSLIKEKNNLRSRIMRSAGFITNDASGTQEIEGYVYDISIESIKVNLLAFGERGIFRSLPQEISNCNSLNIQSASIIPSIEALTSSYIKDYIILSDRVLLEAYAGLKIYDRNGGLLINDLIPLPDDKYKQEEYIEPVGKDFRFKLFPLLPQRETISCINQIRTRPKEDDEQKTVDDRQRPRDPEAGYVDVDDVLIDAKDYQERIGDSNNSYSIAWDGSSWDREKERWAQVIDYEKVIVNYVQYEVESLDSMRLFSSTADTETWYGWVNIADYIKDDGEVVSNLSMYLPYSVTKTQIVDTVNATDNSVGYITDYKITPLDVSEGIRKNSVRSIDQAKVDAINSTIAWRHGDFDSFTRYMNERWKLAARRAQLNMAASQKLEKMASRVLSVDTNNWTSTNTDWVALRKQYGLENSTYSANLVRNRNYGVTIQNQRLSTGSRVYTNTGGITVTWPASKTLVIQAGWDRDIIYKGDIKRPRFEALDPSEVAILLLCEQILYEPGDIIEIFFAPLNITFQVEVMYAPTAGVVVVQKSEFGVPDDHPIFTTQLGPEVMEIYKSSGAMFEVYEEERLLELGVHYLISPDNGSNWYSALPSTKRIRTINQKATAGDFLVKILNPKLNKFYIAKYFILQNQFLSKTKKVILQNSKLKILPPLCYNEGTVQSIFVMRGGLKNKFLSPIIYEYSLNIFEDKPQKIRKGLKFDKNLTIKNRRNTLNVN